MQISPIPAHPTSLSPETQPARSDELKDAARQFEAAFIKQMLQYAGLAEALGSKEGVATDAFSAMVLDKVAEQMVDQGGFGLADDFYRQLAARQEAEDSAGGVRL